MLKTFVFILCVLVSSLNAVPVKPRNSRYHDLLKSISESRVQKRSAQTVSVTPSTCLSAHNDKRGLHQSTSDLTWDASIASGAASYALYLAENNLWEHSDTSYGENLYRFSSATWGSSSSVTTHNCGDAVTSWYSEINYYNWDNPGTSTVGKAIGHFTQIVWKATTSVGVGKATVTDDSPDADGWTWTHTYIVARYNPAGNVIGQYGTNVAAVN